MSTRQQPPLSLTCMATGRKAPITARLVNRWLDGLPVLKLPPPASARTTVGGDIAGRDAPTTTTAAGALQGASAAILDGAREALGAGAAGL